MSVAILTKYLGPTNYRGARIKAYTESGITETVYWDHAKTIEENHTAAAEALAEKMTWAGEWVGGGTVLGYAFVNSTACFQARFKIKREEPT